MKLRAWVVFLIVGLWGLIPTFACASPIGLTAIFDTHGGLGNAQSNGDAAYGASIEIDNSNEIAPSVAIKAYTAADGPYSQNYLCFDCPDIRYDNATLNLKAGIALRITRTLPLERVGQQVFAVAPDVLVGLDIDYTFKVLVDDNEVWKGDEKTEFSGGRVTSRHSSFVTVPLLPDVTIGGRDSSGEENDEDIDQFFFSPTNLTQAIVLGAADSDWMTVELSSDGLRAIQEQVIFFIVEADLESTSSWVSHLDGSAGNPGEALTCLGTMNIAVSGFYNDCEKILNGPPSDDCLLGCEYDANKGFTMAASVLKVGEQRILFSSENPVPLPPTGVLMLAGFLGTPFARKRSP